MTFDFILEAFRFSDPVRRAWETTPAIARLLDAQKLVFQCPASYKPKSENKDQMREFSTRIDRSNITCMWEPRGKWQSDEITALCRELNLIHCVDPLKTECVTDRLRYYRLHGTTGYRHQYTDRELQALAQHCAKGNETYFLFNNVSMLRDAVRFKELLNS